MEYNLLKQIEPNIGFLFPSQTHPQLTPYPALDYVNPGLGQVIRIHNFMVPLHTQDSLHLIQKENDLEDNLKLNELQQQLNDQVGSGLEDFNDKKEKLLIQSQIHQSPTELNLKKRKLLGEPIFESFLHPKKVKIGEMNLSSNESKKTTIGKGAKTSSVKHNFSFL